MSPAVQCSGGQVYQECGRACGDSCSDGLNCDDAVDGTGLRTCVPGCQCPPGLMQDHQGQCVPINMCPCTQGGTTYQPGAVIQNSCNTWYVDSSSCMENDSIVFFVCFLAYKCFIIIPVFSCLFLEFTSFWWCESSDEIILCSCFLIQDRLISLHLFPTQPSACSAFWIHLLIKYD